MNGKNISRILCFVMVCFVIIAAAISAVAAPTPEDPLLIEMAHASPNIPDESYVIILDETKKKMEELTNGAVRFEIKGDGQLGQDDELVEGMRLGTIECYVVPAAQMPAVKALGVLDMPFVFTSSEQCFDFIDNAPVVKKMEQQITEKYNGVVIGWCFNGFRNLLNNRQPIKTVEDFKGLKVRVMGNPVYMKLFSMLGANPTPMSLAESITGLEQGTIDAMDHPITAAYNQGTAKLVKYYDLSNHTCTLCPVVIRKDIYDQMSPEYQGFLMESGKYATQMQRKRLAEMESDMLKKMEASGNIIGRDVDKVALQKVLLPMYSELREQLDPELFDEALKYLGISIQ